MANTVDMNTLAAAPLTGKLEAQNSSPSSWFEALSNAWGQTLDGEAGKLKTMSEGLSKGMDNPSQVTQLTAEALKMSFLTQSSSTSIDTVGKALETMSRKG